jgi:hypothetical protein
MDRRSADRGNRNLAGLGSDLALLPRSMKVAPTAVVAVLVAYIAGRNRGSKDERVHRAKKDARAVQTRKETDNEVRNLPDADVDRRLDKWMRD